MSEYIEVGQPLQFTDPNTPTRVGEIVENVSDIYNIPSPRLGMQVFVKSEKKSFVITSLKSKVIGGVDVLEAAVEAFEAVGAKSITWNNDNDPSNMNDFTIAGVYDIKGEHTRDDDNLPILNTGGGHTFNARLTVLDSSIPDTTNSDDKCITQVLSFSNRLGQGEVYIRTGKGSSLDNLTWEKWSALQRNVNVGEVGSLDDLKDNGIYSGVWKQGRINPIPLAFVCIVINDYFIGVAPRRISQFVYGLSKSDGSVVYQSRVWDESKGVWSVWEILNYKEIASMISAEIKKVTDGIDPNKIDSLKDIITWIEEHGDVANILAAINSLSEDLGREINARTYADNDTRSKGVLFGYFSNRQTTANEVVIGYKNINQKGEGAFTIPAATTEKAGVMSAEDKAKLNNLSQAGGGGVAELMEVTYSELVALRDKARLVAGMKYRITNYVTTTVQQDTKSANHPFDVIVEAVSENELSELAQAIQHEGDTYFDGNDLGAWQLWYSLDNDTDKYAWADTENGKGVIYRMIDEKRNDCPYDFKNILFYTTVYTSNTTYDKYYYTFSYVLSGVLYDGTVMSDVQSCYGNVMKPYYPSQGIQSLNRNTFRNISARNGCHSNTFGYNCYSNTFGYNCYSNTFRYLCHSNTFGDSCYSNTFEYNCYSNTFEYNCYSNTFGYNCYSNTFGYNCYSNTFRYYSNYNSFEYLQNTTLNGNKTSITLNEEFYSDGSGSLVPIKHPDLSTQPSILPYKFMGQYVYEQLIPIDSLELQGGSLSIPKNIFLYNNVLVLGCDFIGLGAYKSGTFDTHYLADDIYTVYVSTSSGAHDAYKYVKIVYTSMPEEGGNYYYNSAIQKGILVKVDLNLTTLNPIYDGITWVEPVVQGQEYYYDIPNDYGYSTAAIGINSSYETITVQYSIPDIGETGSLEYDSVAKLFELSDGLVNKAKQYLVIITIE